MKNRLLVMGLILVSGVVWVFAGEAPPPKREKKQDVAAQIQDIRTQATRLTYIAKAFELGDRELLEQVSHKLDLLLSLHHLMEEQATR